MKPRALFAIFVIAAFFIIIALPNYSQAVTFPKTYSGSALYRTTLTTSGTPFHCETDTKIEITLLADGKLIAQMGKMKISVSGPQCTLTPTEETSTFNGTHDLQRSFEITMALSKLIITGTYDDVSITGSVDNGTTFISFTLPADSQPPQITLEPVKYSDFLASVLTRKGFTVKIRKEDGVKDSKGNWKLNFSTLVFATDGADNSLNFINTAINQGIITADVDEDEKEIRFNIIPDPNKFMTDQNVFNIQKNGDHKIGLQICDTEGLCGKSENTIYFGPFISVGSVTDRRCNGGGQQLDLGRFFVGNMGYDSPKTALLIALTDLPNDYYMFYELSSEIWYEKRSFLFMDEFPLPIGSVARVDNLPLNLSQTLSFSNSLGFTPFPAGNYSFHALIIDSNSKAQWHYAKDVKTCSQ